MGLAMKVNLILYDAQAANADSAGSCPGGQMSKIFWRLILPIILAGSLAAGLTLGVMERRVWWPTRPWWWQRSYLYVAAGIFVALFLATLWKTLTWGRESEEYAELLKEEEVEEEKTRRRRDHPA
jgi:hypothetical protein